MLHGLIVLDLTRYLPGPYTTQVLADLGARVIKVEAPPLGDPTRHLPPHDQQGVAAFFRALNQGKESLALDLKRPGATALLADLAARADVLVEGFRPGVLERLGLTPAACHERNPGLVWCSISGFGQDGPARDRAGHDITYQAYSGALWLNAHAGDRPVTPGLQSADLMASLSALTGILAALVERGRTGRGRVVDASMLDALVSVQGPHLLCHLAGERAGPGVMPLSGAFPCYRTYRCQDGRDVAFGPLEPKFFETFCDIVGRPDWLPRQFDPGLHAELEALFATRPRDEWRLILEEAEVCLAPVLDYDEVVADPHVQARGLVTPEKVAPPVRFQGVPLPGPRPAPRWVGEHTRKVLGELLDLTDEAVAALEQDGVVSHGGG
jgi:crotonobetainyl-CoA:carnitine CoA-transferase CaiB-like acyl-CoA transferase